MARPGAWMLVFQSNRNLMPTDGSFSIIPADGFGFPRKAGIHYFFFACDGPNLLKSYDRRYILFSN